ncbi:hypothetical protein D3C81_1696720 [compost metagenome]
MFSDFSSVTLGGRLFHIQQHVVAVSLFLTTGFLVKMFKNVLRYLINTFRCHQRTFGIDGFNLTVRQVIALFHGANIINTEGQDIFIVNRINDSVGMQLCPEQIFGGSLFNVTATTGIDGKNWCAGKSKQEVLFEGFLDSCLHITKL